MSNLKIITSIDPSARNQIGFAQIRVQDREPELVLNETYVVNKSSKNIFDVAEHAVREIANRCLLIPDYLIIEYPQYMGGTKGAIAAQKGYTIDLAYLCGYFAAYYGLGRFKTQMFTPIQWKGTMPKSATLAAFKRTFPDERVGSEHSVDAAMLGYYFCKIAKLID